MTIIDLREILSSNESSPIFASDYPNGDRPSGGAGTVSIIGTSNIFGNKPNSGRNSYFNYEEWDAGTDVSDIGYTSDIADFVYVTDDRCHSGTKSIKCVYPTGDNNGLFPTVRKAVANASRKLYYGTWMYWEKIPTTHDVGIFKLFRCAAGNPYTGNPRFYMSVQGNEFGAIESTDSGIAMSSENVIYAGDVNTIAIPNPIPMEASAWHYMEWLCNLSTGVDTEDGSFESYVDGTKVISMLNQNTRAIGQEAANIENYITIFDGLDRIYDEVSVWGDEEYTDNTFCRVMMTDSATYSTSTKWAIQPVVTWSGNLVVVDRRRGAFSIGETAYRHVFNDAGTLVHTSDPFTVIAD